MKNKMTLSKVIIYLILVVLAAIFVLPMLLVVIVSFTDEFAIGMNGYSFFPEAWSLDAYSRLFYPGSNVYQSYAVTIFITIVGTVSAVVITYLVAYPLANKQVKYRNGIALFFFITTVFNAGLVPWYLMCRTLGLYDNIFALIIPSMIFSPFNMFLMRNYIATIPNSLMESARIDGASEVRIAFQIFLPLSKPILATIALFCGIGYWNSWYNAVMLLNDADLYPLQMLLFRIQSDIRMLTDLASAGGTDRTFVPPTESFKMATVVVTVGPVLLFYPFLQKYIVKGIMIGSIKG